MRLATPQALLGAMLMTLLSACVDKAGISGAAMMRVEVEVYKGPVGQSREIQIGELSALLAEAVRAMHDWKNGAKDLEQAVKGPCKSGSYRDCAILRQAIGSAADVAAAICHLNSYALPTRKPASGGTIWSYDSCAAVEGQFPPPDSVKPWLADTKIGASPTADEITGEYAEYSRRVSIITSQMQIVANRLVGSTIGYVPKRKEIRHAITSLEFLLGELSNNISARNSTLQKVLSRCINTTNNDSHGQSGLQNDECSYVAQKLPTGDYLRDVDPSRFMDAFGWFNAAFDTTGTGALVRRNRTRVIQALADDYYWEKVNEVYASGQGDVSMAFIKDELGNWNLKSYTNDPAKLLAAYRNAGNAALSTVAKLARRAAGDPGAAGRGSSVLDLADRLATGRNSASTSVGGLALLDFRRRTTDRLKAARDRFRAREDQLLGPMQDGQRKTEQGEIARLEDLALSAGKAAEDARKAVESKERTRIAQQARLASCPADAACVAGLESAIEALASARSDLTARLAAQREAVSKLDVARAEAAALGERAAEAADQILADYQHDLLTLQQVATSRGANASTAARPQP